MTAIDAGIYYANIDLTGGIKTSDEKRNLDDLSSLELFARICKDRAKGEKIAEEIGERVSENGGWNGSDLSAKILLCGKELPDSSVRLPKKQPLRTCEIAVRAGEGNYLLVKVKERWWQTKIALNIR